jgi:hypothetical protein
MFFCTRNQVPVEEAYIAGQKVMGRANRRLGKLLSGSPEDLRFRAFFGVSAQVAVTAWSVCVLTCLPAREGRFQY